MQTSGWLQLALYVVALAAITKPMGLYLMQVLDPLHIGQNVKEVLDCDLQAEYSARALSFARM